MEEPGQHRHQSDNSKQDFGKNDLLMAVNCCIFIVKYDIYKPGLLNYNRVDLIST